MIHLTVVSMMKDENHIINEWLYWYLKCIQADEIFIGDNQSTNPIEKSVIPQMLENNRGRVHFFDHNIPCQTSLFSKVYTGAQERAIEENRLESSWILFCDADEFFEIGLEKTIDGDGLEIETVPGQRLRGFLENVSSEVGSIVSHWRIVGPPSEKNITEKSLMSQCKWQINWTNGFDYVLQLPTFVKSMHRLSAIDVCKIGTIVHTAILKNDQFAYHCMCSVGKYMRSETVYTGRREQCNCALTFDLKRHTPSDIFYYGSVIHMYTQSWEQLAKKAIRQEKFHGKFFHSRETHEKYYKDMLPFQNFHLFGDLFDKQFTVGF